MKAAKPRRPFELPNAYPDWPNEEGMFVSSHRQQPPSGFRVFGQRAGACWLLLLFAIGCSSGERLALVSSDDVEKLPDVQKKQIQDVLATQFGTPAEPRFLLPTAARTPAEQSPALAAKVPQQQLRQGAQVYNRFCAGCHGITGDGAGEAASYLMPRPRDYRRGVFKFTSTPYGSKPRRQDLIRTLRYGAKGTAMPSFRWMADQDVQAVVDYVIMLTFRGELEYRLAMVAQDYSPDETIEPDEVADVCRNIERAWDEAALHVVVPQSPRPPYSDASIELGRQAFLTYECFKCHGQDGRGQTEWLSPRFIAQQESLPEAQRIKINYDAWGHPGPAADLTAGMLHGGRRPVDVYRRIYSGINGTPMPGFANQFAGEKQETMWHLTHFVISLTQGREFHPSGY